VGWLERAYLPGVSGWPVTFGDTRSSVWGGSIDGVRAFAAIERLRQAEPHIGLPDHFHVPIGDVIRTLANEQSRNGSFASAEFGFGGVEPTAWVLIGLHDANQPRTRQVKRALSYLSSRVSNVGGVVSEVEAQDRSLRLIPAAMTLWALAVWEHDPVAQRRIGNFLLSARDPNTGGWSTRRNGSPNPAMTAMVLYALLTAESPVSDEVRRSAVKYLVKLQLPDGSWQPASDHWPFTVGKETRFARFHVAGVFWALLALSMCHDRLARDACRRAVRAILAEQDTTENSDDPRKIGSWEATYDNGVDRYVWLVSQGVVALVNWRLSRPQSRRARLFEICRDSLQWTMSSLARHGHTLGLLALTIVVFSQQLDSGMTTIGSWFHLDGGSLREELLIAIIIGSIIGLARKAFHRRKDD
jgi:hypothetical protein